MTTTDIGQLQRDAGKAQDALAAEQERQAAAAKAATDERTARSVEWSFATILAYPGRLAAASDKVTTTLATFRAAVRGDLNAALAAYHLVAAAMGEANRLGEDLAQARGTLRTAGIIPPGRANLPDPTGISAPYPFHGIPPALPSFLDMLGSELDAARAAAIRAPSTADPATFTGKATEAMRRAVLAAEYHGDEELALLAALKAKDPDRYARIPADQQAAVAAWLACRAAAGRSGDPLPKVAAPERIASPEPPKFAPNDAVRIRLYSDEHAPRIR